MNISKPVIEVNMDNLWIDDDFKEHIYHSCGEDKDFFNSQFNRCPRCVAIAGEIAHQAKEKCNIVFTRNVED